MHGQMRRSVSRHGVLVATGLLVSTFLCPASAAPPDESALQLRAAGIDASQSSLRVTLANEGAQPIRAFFMTSRNGAVEVTEGLPPGPPLVPVGGSRVEALSIRSVPTENLDDEARSFAVTCVQWEDGSVEGRPEHVAMLLQIQAGRALQLRRLAVMFDRIQQSTGADWNVALADAAQWIGASGATLDDGTRAKGSFATGMANANLGAKMDLDSLQRLSADSSQIPALREYLVDVISSMRTTTDFLVRVKGLSAYGPNAGQRGQ